MRTQEKAGLKSRENQQAPIISELGFEDIPAQMRQAKRWLVWRSGSGGGGKKPRKVPYYTNHIPRTGQLDSAEDLARLGSFEQAVAALSDPSMNYSGLGFALGPDGTGNHWQGVDLDDIAKHPGLDILVEDLPGYTESSPSGAGMHAIGYGKPFGTLGSNGTGIEAYSSGRYFTVTAEGAGLGEIEDISGFVNQRLAPLHGGQRKTSEKLAEDTQIDLILPAAARDLKSALEHIDPDNYDDWIAVGQALKRGGSAGRDIWAAWSQKSAKWQPEDAHRWHGFAPTRWQLIFTMATARGWTNSATIKQGANKPEIHDQDLPGYSFDSVKIDNIQFVDYIIKGVMNRGEVAVVFGDSGSMKSFVCADMLFHAVVGWDWRGHKVQPSGCAGLVVLGEGQAGYQKRLAALRKHYNKELGDQSVPIWVVPKPVRLDTGSGELTYWIEKAEEKLGQEIKVILMDTLSLMLGDGEESSNSDIAIALNNARAAIGNRTIILVHHTGHGDKTRERGAYQIRGNADVRILIKRDEGGKGKVITVSSLKSKDDFEFADIALSFKVVTLGIDQDGDDISSVVVIDTDLKPVNSSGIQSGSKPFEYVLEAIKLAGSNSKEPVRPHFYSIYPSESEKTKRNKFAEGWAEYMNKICKAADQANSEEE